MEYHELRLHLDQFNEEFNIDMTPDGRARKLTTEFCEFLQAEQIGTPQEADDEAIDVLTCSIQLCTARGIKNPLDAVYHKIQRTAAKYRLSGVVV